MTKALVYANLPPPKSRAARKGPELREIYVRLEVVTPILGGSHRPRDIDDIDVIRVPSVRGHLLPGDNYISPSTTIRSRQI